MDNSVLILNGQVVRTDGLFEADGKLKFLTKLWENPNPTEAFAGDTAITLSSDDYDFLLIVCSYDTADSVRAARLMQKGKTTTVDYGNGGSTGSRVFYRPFRTVTGTNLQIMAGKGYDATAGSSEIVNNSYMIPQIIYGLKKEYDIDALARNATAKEIYSTDETVVGTWVDGKPIYRKVLVDAFTIPASQTAFATGSAIVSNVDELIKSTLIAKRTNNWHCNSSYYYYESGGNADVCSLWVDPSVHAIKPYAKNGIAADTTYTAIVEYTKTTD